MPITIREEQPEDRAAVFDVNLKAFGKDGEARLVDALRDGGFARLSLVAEDNGLVVGHVLFSELRIVDGANRAAALALAPVAVLPEFQKRGIGSAIIRHGLALCAERGHTAVIVLGEPAYYGRFGIKADIVRHLESAYAGEYFMGLELAPRALKNARGRVEYAPPFQGLEEGA